MQADIFAGLRDLSHNRLDDATELWRPYQSDPQKGYVFFQEMIEVTSAVAAIAADFGLPIRKVLEHIVQSVPTARHPVFRDAVDLVIAVNEDRDPEEQSRSFRSQQELRAFFVALWNIALYLVRQIARGHQMTEDELYESLQRRASGGPRF